MFDHSLSADLTRALHTVYVLCSAFEYLDAIDSCGKNLQTECRVLFDEVHESVLLKKLEEIGAECSLHLLVHECPRVVLLGNDDLDDNVEISHSVSATGQDLAKQVACLESNPLLQRENAECRGYLVQGEEVYDFSLFCDQAFCYWSAHSAFVRPKKSLTSKVEVLQDCVQG